MHKRIPVTGLDVWVSSSAVRCGFSAGNAGVTGATEALTDREAWLTHLGFWPEMCQKNKSRSWENK